ASTGSGSAAPGRWTRPPTARCAARSPARSRPSLASRACPARSTSRSASSTSNRRTAFWPRSQRPPAGGGPPRWPPARSGSSARTGTTRIATSSSRFPPVPDRAPRKRAGMRSAAVAHAGSGSVVVGGGFFGCALALALRERGQRVTLIEREPDLLQRASALNQARVHGGYHYPRSILTGLRSRVNCPRFLADFPGCVDRSFRHYY